MRTHTLTPLHTVILLLLSILVAGDADTATTYIVRVRNNLKPSVFPDIDSWYSYTLDILSHTPLDSRRDSVRRHRRPIHVYRTVFHGFSAVLSMKEAEALRSHPAILALFHDRPRQLHTTRSPQFLGLVTSNSKPKALLAAADFGSGVVIAVLDTGITPNHRSFRDTGLGSVPARWNGTCEAGDGSFPVAACNRKLVGARSFPGGFMSAKGSRSKITGDILSPVDTIGHGTHTASTAAGTPTNKADLFGYAAGVASGVAPKARIAVYKVCWSTGCFSSDILRGIDSAVEDGADVISLSFGAGPTPYHLDPVAIGAFGAMEKGVFVTASAGNDGPGEMTAGNIAPWITTVGAGTIDRNFPADVVLDDGRVLTGASLYAGPTEDGYLPLVYGANASSAQPGYKSSAPLCMRRSLDPDKARGKIVLCERGGISRVEKGLAVKEAGGAGMIVANQSPDGNGVIADAHLLPAVAVGESDGYDIHAYISTHADPSVRFRFRGTETGSKPAPVVASFSSRGPNAQSPHILKPDVIAPGVGILAAWAEGVGPTGLPSDERRAEFNVMSGTSMSCPHVAGMAALLKAANPAWSPSIIRSALMTTAYVADNSGEELVDESTGNKSMGWAMGAGHVDPERAIDPGLVYDLTAEDYAGFLCNSNYSRPDIAAVAGRAVKCPRKAGNPWDLNYPAIVVVLDQSTAGKFVVTARRTATSVAKGKWEYKASVENPAGAWITVEPERMVFEERGQQRGFEVRVLAESLSLPPWGSRTEFGSVTWSDGKHTVRSPIGVTWQQPY